METQLSWHTASQYGSNPCSRAHTIRRTRRFFASKWPKPSPWYRRRGVPHSETGLYLWRPPEPGMHCRPASDLNRWSAFSAVNWRLTCSMSHFQNSLIKLITVILIWRFTHFYRILYCFYIVVQWSCSNLCDSATLDIHFCNSSNNKNSNYRK